MIIESLLDTDLYKLTMMQAVAKLSDDPAKTLCTDAAYLAYLKKVFSVC